MTRSIGPPARPAPAPTKSAHFVDRLAIKKMCDFVDLPWGGAFWGACVPGKYVRGRADLGGPRLAVRAGCGAFPARPAVVALRGRGAGCVPIAGVGSCVALAWCGGRRRAHRPGVDPQSGPTPARRGTITPGNLSFWG